MSEAPEAFLEQALALPLEERARLATDLLASLDDEATDEAEVERLWSAETERRAAQITSGEVDPTSWEHAVATIDGLRGSPRE